MLKKSEVRSDKCLTIMCLLMPLGLICFYAIQKHPYIFVASIQISKKERRERERYECKWISGFQSDLFTPVRC